MKIDVTEVIKDLDGREITEDGKGLTYRVLFYAALNNFRPDEPVPTSETKARCFGLMQKLFTSQEVSLTVEECALLKERIGILYSPLIYGMSCIKLESTPSPE